ncbi:uncharacterized protein V6R79_004658 [Siganus canaliculatus]
MMKILCLILLFHGSLQLQCDKRQVTAHVGGEFIVICKYEYRYLYSKKYWCKGDSRSTCVILVDSEGKNAQRFSLVDAGRGGLIVKGVGLQMADAGMYWIGIDKIYADIMTSVKVVITEVPVSKPRLWPLSSLAERSTCSGQSVTVRCGCTAGTAVHYTWYKTTGNKEVLLHHLTDLNLHCGVVEKHNDFYCVASNDISSQESHILSVQVLVPAESNCIYIINMQDQPIYDCADRMSTTTTKPLPLSSCQVTTKLHSDAVNHSLQLNQTDNDLFYSREWMGMPFWYMPVRWGCFLSLPIFLCIVLKCSHAHHKRVKRKRMARFKRRNHLVY